MKITAFILLSLLVFGCSYESRSTDPITPVTYESELQRSVDSVGRLRSLAIMPIKYETYEGRYESKEEEERATLDFEEACADYLHENKGYEIVSVRDNIDKLKLDLFEKSEYENIQVLYQNWHNKRETLQFASVVRNIGRSLKVDGILICQVKDQKLWGVTKTLLNLALMNTILFHDLTSPDIGVWMYETYTGRLVWSKQRSIDEPVGNSGFQVITTPDDLVKLFADLENAVPQQLIK